MVGERIVRLQTNNLADIFVTLQIVLSQYIKTIKNQSDRKQDDKEIKTGHSLRPGGV